MEMLVLLLVLESLLIPLSLLLMCLLCSCVEFDL